jgi:SPP1 family predicted phage head-tail adaptor
MNPFKYKQGLNSGQFRHRITFEKFGEGHDQDGFPQEGWEQVTSCWAAIKTPKGQEFYSGNTDQNEVIYRFIIRDQKGLHPDMRIKYDNRVFSIDTILPDDEMGITLTVIAKELV